ncbi:type IVB secretion system protein IcmH/DotU [Pseudomonas sp. Pseusp122]|uniref:type IVB secretion system protein IcmH/DotU n=1 Tax=unclassified Pseudomonas TaxID=196821 RepID=UPI0039A6AAAB
MTRDIEYNQDDKTVLFDHRGNSPASAALTSHESPPDYKQLEERMIYAARLRPAEAFNVSLNLLVAAASELLSQVVRFKHSKVNEELLALNQSLTEGLKLFDVRALHSGVESSMVLTARYILCTVIDEAVVSTSWGNESQWSQMSLLSRFHNETFGGEKFFRLLDELTKNPVKNLPILELMYLCMALGFEGKYRVKERGVLELEGIRDALYRQIRQLRGDVPRGLSPHWEGLSDQRSRLVRIVPTWMVLLFTGICLVAMYSGFAWVLDGQRSTVLKPYQPLELSAARPQSQL